MAFAEVAHATGQSNGGATAAQSANFDSTGAKLIVVSATWFGGSASVTDNQGNTYTPGTPQGSSGSRRGQLWYCINPTTNATHNVTNSAAFPSVEVIAFSESGTISFDQESGSSGSDQPGAIDPSSDNGLLVAGMGFSDNATLTIDSGFTTGSGYQEPNQGNTVGGAIAYLVQTSHTSVNPKWDISGSAPNNSRATMMSFTTSGGGGTTFDITPSGSVTATGALAKQVNKSVAGSSTGAGTLAKQCNKPLAGSLTPAGTMANLTAKSLAGSVAPSGTLAKQDQKALAGSVTPSGSLSNLGVKIRTFDGSCTSSGTLTRSTGKALAGSSTPAGALAKSASKQLDGSCTSSGALAKQTQKGVSGSVTPSGSLSVFRLIVTAFSGAVTAVGALAKFVAKLFGGSMTASGSLSTSGGSPVVLVYGVPVFEKLHADVPGLETGTADVPGLEVGAADVPGLEAGGFES